jgi:hypothetical protein
VSISSRQIAVLTTLIATCSCAPGQEPAAIDQSTRAAILGFKANRSGFAYYKCTYTVTKAEAKSFQDAVTGKWINAVQSEFKLVVNGSTELAECRYEDAPAARAKSGAKRKNGLEMRTVPFVANARLTDGKQAIVYASGVNAINLHTESKPAVEVAITPWSMWLMGHGAKWIGPDALISNPDRYEFFPEGPVNDDGRLVVGARFVDREYKTDMRFRLDPSRGHLPAFVSAHTPTHPVVDNHPFMECRLTSARDCGGGRWFPESWRAIVTPSSAGGNYGVTDLMVTELDCTNRPSDADLSINVPAGVEVCSDLEPGQIRQFVLRQAETIGPNDISKLFVMLDKTGTKSLVDTAIPRSNRQWYWRVGLTFCAVVAIAWGCRRLIRHRRLSGS